MRPFGFDSRVCGYGGDAVVELTIDGYTIRASPRASYGYLYIAAWPGCACGGPLNLKGQTRCADCIDKINAATDAAREET